MRKITLRLNLADSLDRGIVMDLLLAGLAYVASLAIFGVVIAGLLVKLGDREGVRDVD